MRSIRRENINTIKSNFACFSSYNTLDFKLILKSNISVVEFCFFSKQSNQIKTDRDMHVKEFDFSSDKSPLNVYNIILCFSFRECRYYL